MKKRKKEIEKSKENVKRGIKQEQKMRKDRKVKEERRKRGKV